MNFASRALDAIAPDRGVANASEMCDGLVMLVWRHCESVIRPGAPNSLNHAWVFVGMCFRLNILSC